MKLRIDDAEGVVGDLPPLEIEAAPKHDASNVALILGRTSGPKQKSIPGQVRICRERCDQRGWATGFVLADEGKTGRNTERPGFQRMLELAQQRRFGILVCWKIDRVCRNLKDAVNLREFLAHYGVEIHSVTEPIDTTTAIGRFIFGNLANAAQLESDMNKERTTMGIGQRVEEGRWPRPWVPFGYRRVKGKKLRIEAGEAALVVLVHQHYIDYESYSEAAHALNQTQHRYKGRRWTEERVRYIVCNPIYRGRIEVGDAVKLMPGLRVIETALEKKVDEVRGRRPRSGAPASESARLASIENVFNQYVASLCDDGF